MRSGLTALLLILSLVPVYGENSGQKLAFISDRGDEIGQIYVMNTDSTGLKKITGLDGIVFYRISVSPDGKKILASGGPITNADMIIEKDDLYIMDTDGSNIRKITGDKSIKDGPGWFPSGNKIVFASNESGRFGIYTAGTDGKNIKN